MAKKQNNKNCEYCGNEFEIRKHPNQIFCSHKCNGEYQKNQVKIKCHLCNKEFEVVLSRNKARFCSRKCYGLWKRKNSLGEKNSFYNKHHTKKTKRKMRESALNPERILISTTNLPKFKKGESPLLGKPLNKEKLKMLEEKVYSKRRNRTHEEIYGINKSKKIKRKASESLIGRVVPTTGKTYEEYFGKEKAEEIKKKLSNQRKLEKNPNWLGGKSFEPYGLEFNNKLRKLVRERDSCCMLCNIGFEDLKLLKRRIHVHHINYDKQCNLLPNLITLCISCHMKTNQNRNSWIKFFQSLLAERYNYQYSENQEIIQDIVLNIGGKK